MKSTLFGLALATSMFIFGCVQEKLLYYPGHYVPDERELSEHGLGFWPAGRADYRGFVGRTPEGQAKGTVVVLHGNAGTAADRLFYLEPLRRLGYRVILAEYPGYGGRNGKLGEESFVRDALETLRLAGSADAPLYLVGESLGAAVAAGVVREIGSDVAGLVLITPWANLTALAKEKFPLLPVGRLLTDRYDSAENLQNFRGRVAVVTAERDEIIPAHHAEELFRSLRGEKRMWLLTGGHNDWPDRIADRDWQEIMAFVATPPAN